MDNKAIIFENTFSCQVSSDSMKLYNIFVSIQLLKWENNIFLAEALIWILKPTQAHNVIHTILFKYSVSLIRIVLNYNI